MKNLSKISLVISFIMAIFSGSAIAAATGWHPAATIAVVFATAFITAPDGLLMFTFAHVSKAVSDKNAGLMSPVYVARRSTFTTLQTYAGADGVLISSNHAFSGTDGFLKVYCTQDKAKLMLESMGGRDNRGAKQTLEFYYPGNDVAAAKFFRNAKNEDWIVLVKAPNGTVFQIGEDGLEAEISYTYDTGTLSAEENGFKGKVEAFSKGGLIIYTGTITLDTA